MNPFTFELNIGLSDEQQERVKQMLSIRSFFSNSITVQFEGEYKGKKENTLYVKATWFLAVSSLIKSVELIATDFCQECIAIKTDHFSMFVYSHTYVGKYEKFNEQYFKTP